jgi:hypothetical protein
VDRLLVAIAISMLGLPAAADELSAQPDGTAAVGARALDTERNSQRSQSLQRLKDITASYPIQIADDDRAVLKLREEPVLRWNAPRMDIRDAAVFLWLKEDRPQAVVGPYISPAHGGRYIQFHSLSQESLIGSDDDKHFWTPERPGLEWKVVPAAPVPADAERSRLRQMRSLAEGFDITAIKGPPNYEPGSTWHLRLMPQPIYRYGDSGGEVLDGAVFALSLGTDPEAFLLLEARAAETGGRQWHFGLAAWCESELDARYGGRQVWFRPTVQRWDANEAYFRLGPYPEPLGSVSETEVEK